jgi:hypothetical protein
MTVYEERFYRKYLSAVKSFYRISLIRNICDITYNCDLPGPPGVRRYKNARFAAGRHPRARVPIVEQPLARRLQHPAVIYKRAPVAHTKICTGAQVVPKGEMDSIRRRKTCLSFTYLFGRRPARSLDAIVYR